MRFTVDTVASPAQVREAMTDFSPRRLQTWSRTLDPRRYELREAGDTWAVAREATAGSPFWVVVRYDWSAPDVVRWEVVDSSYGGGGTGSVRAEPREGGSRVHAEWSYTDATRQRAMLRLLQAGPVPRLVHRLWGSSLDRYARDQGGAAAPGAVGGTS